MYKDIYIYIYLTEIFITWQKHTKYLAFANKTEKYQRNEKKK